MQNLNEFNDKIKGTDYYFHRNNFRDNYTFLEKYCKENYKNKNVHICLPKIFNFIKEEEILKNVKILIALDYIKDNNFGFNVNPSVKNSTDLLRQHLLNNDANVIDDNQNKSLFVLLKQIRDNLIHDGKFELEEMQFERNLEITKIASEISNTIIVILKNTAANKGFMQVGF